MHHVLSQEELQRLVFAQESAHKTLLAAFKKAHEKHSEELKELTFKVNELNARLSHLMWGRK